MSTALKVLGALFVVLSLAAIGDGIHRISAYREAQFLGHVLTQSQFLILARDLAFIWLFAAIYASVGVALWQRRRLNFLFLLLMAALVGQWMNVGYRNGFVLSFVALGMLALPAVRATFRR
jgi:hypothetical protein